MSRGPLPARAAAQAAVLRLQARTRCGVLELAVPPLPGAQRELAAALAIGRVEPLLQQLEDWLGEPIDLALPAQAAPASGACARWPLPEGNAALIVLPWPWLQQLIPANADALTHTLQWDSVPLQLVVSRQTLPPAEWRLLQQPGAALVLPESAAGGGWRCSLRLLDSVTLAPVLPCDWPAQWQPNALRLQWQPVPADPEPDADTSNPVFELRMQRLLQVEPPALFGWRGAPECRCDADTAVVLYRLRAGSRRAEGDAVLQGRLLPIGLPVGLPSAGSAAAHVMRVESVLQG